jgi:hypothetical protein
MLKAILLTATMLLASANFANALSKHEADIQYIDSALRTARLSPAKKAEVVRLRNEGSTFHFSGKHGKAEKVLEKAKAILSGH